MTARSDGRCEEALEEKVREGSQMERGDRERRRLQRQVQTKLPVVKLNNGKLGGDAELDSRWSLPL